MAKLVRTSLLHRSKLFPVFSIAYGSRP
jgi:hypothetical protein